INWARGWGIVALFPLIGCLKIRPQLIFRAICIVCLQSLILIPIGYAASLISLPSPLYISPLKAISGGGTILYEVYLYIVDPENGGQIRLALFTPWAPALGLVGNIHLILASKEDNKVWRWIGIVGAIAMIFVSISRLAILCLPTVPFLTWYVLNFTRPYVQISTGLTGFFTAIFANSLIEFFQDLKEAFTKARASSSRVREVLGRMALYRWWNEAPIWGHGLAPAKGTKVTAGMPIGSHHTWFGLLYINGLVGAFAIAIACVTTLITLVFKAQNDQNARVGLSLFLVICLFTFGENIDSLAYVYWPGLVMIGIALKQDATVTQPKANFSPLVPRFSFPSHSSSLTYLIDYGQTLSTQVKQKLSSKFVRNMGWMGGAELVNRVFRLGTTVTLARMFTTYDYGLLAIVMTTYDIASVFVQKSGIAAKLIQADEKDVDVLCDTAYWLSWILCSGLFLIQCIIAFILALVYQDNNLILPICVLGIFYLLIPLFEIQAALIQRENRLDVIATCNAVQSMVSNVMTVALALTRIGIWAVIIPFGLSTFVWVFINRKNKSWKSKKSFTLYRWQEIASFGKNILLVEILNKFRANLDYLLVGAFLGIKDLGIYYFAFNAG
ncbi:MAG: oligosaccharide flippase family protein, partial [Scytonema sp. PMC 1069.18]|nr:oligosaccharide flippase family protein [Scytonema sp. PMC 1069.18]